LNFPLSRKNAIEVRGVRAGEASEQEQSQKADSKESLENVVVFRLRPESLSSGASQED
jgi:hypothetical protein